MYVDFLRIRGCRARRPEERDEKYIPSILRENNTLFYLYVLRNHCIDFLVLPIVTNEVSNKNGHASKSRVPKILFKYSCILILCLE